MKILLDVVYTGRASTCSTSYLAWEIIRDFAKRREDVFFYLMYPEGLAEYPDELEFLRQYPERVLLIPVAQSHLDRVRELYSLPNTLRSLLHPIGSRYWDFDFVVSSRIPQLAAFRPLCGRQTGFGRGSFRGFYGLEEMPILSFRKTVPWGDYMEMQTLTNYLLCDGVLINNLWTYKPLSVVAKKYLSPMKQRELFQNVHEVVPVTLQRLVMKKSLYRDGEDFFAAFTGRVTSTRSFDKVAETFRNHFSYPIGKNKKHLKFVVSTNSKTFGAHTEEDIGFMDVQFNGREEFYRMLETQAHVVLNLSDVEDFSLSTYETLLRGVPIIVMDRDWNSFLGPDYPFRVSTMVEVYAMVTAFVQNYKAQYAKFVEWERTWWRDMVEGEKNITTSEVLWGLLMDFEERRTSYIIDRGIGGSYIELAEAIASKGLDEVNVVREMEQAGVIVRKEDAQLMRSPSPLTLRLLLLLRGYQDTNRPGVMRKQLTAK